MLLIVCVCGRGGGVAVPGCPSNLDNSRAWAYWASVGADRSCLDIFALVSFLPLWETARYRLKYYLKGPLTQNN